MDKENDDDDDMIIINSCNETGLHTYKDFENLLVLKSFTSVLGACDTFL